MAVTSSVQLTNDWQLVASAGEDFSMENTGSRIVYYSFQLSTPISTAAYHMLRPAEFTLRYNLTGNVYARSGEDDEAEITITK